jgi:hypothetical protein
MNTRKLPHEIETYPQIPPFPHDRYSNKHSYLSFSLPKKDAQNQKLSYQLLPQHAFSKTVEKTPFARHKCA